jgi:primase-polymerase (primpol)-like protein
MSHRELLVPDDLIELDQWALWPYEPRNGRKAKVPYQVGLCRASSIDPTTWASFDTVSNERPSRRTGIPV